MNGWVLLDQPDDSVISEVHQMVCLVLLWRMSQLMLEHPVKWSSVLVRREIDTECECVQLRGLNRGCALEDMKMRLMFSIHQVVLVFFESGSMWRSNLGVLDMFMCDLQVSRGELVVHDRGSSVVALQVIIKLVVYGFSDNKVWHLVS